ncbi:hypothetical protein [Clostridium perfringens]|uniref:Uncharacterized protein n=1 Tax=Clostridium perfringens E str. JGS1987 TaxID=451755 RepID=B1BR35_CLOPF|nr:hypothetical protein [Clostridium perfringens]EDT15850.1 conserved hypothetical protein [Clostridium perfringens E str. JGS1987]MCX0407830.1 hypothetical protein [Clostridium perfringens]
MTCIRKQYGNSLDSDLYMKIRSLATELSDNNLKNNIKKRVFINDLIEEGMRYVLDNKSLNFEKQFKDNRIDVSIKLDPELYLEIKVLALRKNVNANDLLELGMIYILDKYKKV